MKCAVNRQPGYAREARRADIEHEFSFMNQHAECERNLNLEPEIRNLELEIWVENHVDISCEVSLF